MARSAALCVSQSNELPVGSDAASCCPISRSLPSCAKRYRTLTAVSAPWKFTADAPSSISSSRSITNLLPPAFLKNAPESILCAIVVERLAIPSSCSAVRVSVSTPMPPQTPPLYAPSKCSSSHAAVPRQSPWWSYASTIGMNRTPGGSILGKLPSPRIRQMGRFPDTAPDMEKPLSTTA